MADAAAYGGPSIVGVSDVVWVTEKGDSCYPSTPNDAGGTSGSELLEKYDPLLLAGGIELCPAQPAQPLPANQASDVSSLEMQRIFEEDQKDRNPT